MLAEEEFVEASALYRRGWSISAIARHLGRDRKTIRGYVHGERMPGVRRRVVADHFVSFEPYVRERLLEDPHLWGSALYDEVVALGYPRSYVTFVRELRRRRLRPRCEACAGVKGGRRSRSSIRPVRRSSGTGSSSRTHLGARRRTCSSARSRTRASFAPSSARAKSRRSWSPGSTPVASHSVDVIGLCPER